MSASAVDLHPPQGTAILIRHVTLRIERRSRLPGQPAVQVGLPVQPATPVLTAPAAVAQPLTLAVARELGIAPSEVQRHLTRTLGSAVEQGEPVAVARRGLRTVQVTAPVAGTLEAVDEELGTLTLVPTVDHVQHLALVSGIVLSADSTHVLLRTNGDVLCGCALLGAETAGRLLVLVDRPDRELAPELITPDVQGAIVVAGMTIGPAAYQRLRELGAQGVIVGSLTAETLRGILDISTVEQLGSGHGGRSYQRLSNAFRQAGFPVLVTEGFGRIALAFPLFQRLQQANGTHAALLYAASLPDIRRPSCLISVNTPETTSEIPRLPFTPGLTVRRVDPEGLGQLGTCTGEPRWQPDPRIGTTTWYVPVTFSERSPMLLPVENLEILAGDAAR